MGGSEGRGERCVCVCVCVCVIGGGIWKPKNDEKWEVCVCVGGGGGGVRIRGYTYSPGFKMTGMNLCKMTCKREHTNAATKTREFMYDVFTRTPS